MMSLFCSFSSYVSVDFTSAAEEKGMTVRTRGLLLYGEMHAHSGRPAPRPATSIEISVGECSQDLLCVFWLYCKYRKS